MVSLFTWLSPLRMRSPDLGQCIEFRSGLIIALRRWRRLRFSEPSLVPPRTASVTFNVTLYRYSRSISVFPPLHLLGARHPVSSHPAAQRLSAQSQPFQHAVVPAHVILAEVTKLPASLSDELEQASPRVVVVLVFAKVFCQPQNSVGQQGNLDFR
jgi:hypothetical protein